LVEVEGEEPFILHPGEFVLGATLEKFTIPNHLAGRLEGKSSLGRLGLLTHSTAGFIDPGFSGHITLELSNTSNLPIALYPGMKVGQLAIFKLSSPAENPFVSGAVGSKYQGQRGPTPSKAYLNFRNLRLCLAPLTRCPSFLRTRSSPLHGAQWAYRLGWRDYF